MCAAQQLQLGQLLLVFVVISHLPRPPSSSRGRAGGLLGLSQRTICLFPKSLRVVLIPLMWNWIRCTIPAKSRGCFPGVSCYRDSQWSALQCQGSDSSSILTLLWEPRNWPRLGGWLWCDPDLTTPDVQMPHSQSCNHTSVLCEVTLDHVFNSSPKICLFPLPGIWFAKWMSTAFVLKDPREAFRGPLDVIWSWPRELGFFCNQWFFWEMAKGQNFTLGQLLSDFPSLVIDLFGLCIR